MSDFNALGHHNSPADDEAIRRLATRRLRDIAKPDGSFLWQPIAVEIGAWIGGTTMMLADLGYRVFTVDTWQGSSSDLSGELAGLVDGMDLFFTFCHNMGSKLFREVIPLRGPSVLWARAWPAHIPIDFLLIDASHRYGDVRDDTILWPPRVRKGGIVSGHDYCDSFPGVKQAVEETGPFRIEGGSVWWRVKE